MQHDMEMYKENCINITYIQRGEKGKGFAIINPCWIRDAT